MKKILTVLFLLPVALFANSNSEYDNTKAPVELTAEWSANDIDDIELDLSSEDLNINISKENKISLRYYGEISGTNIKPEDYIDISVRSEKLIIKRRSNVDFSIFKTYNMNLDLNIPEKMFNSVDIDISSGDTNIELLNAKSFEMDSSSGSSNIKTLLTETSSLDSSSGDITVLDFAGELEAEASSGNISISISEYRDYTIDLEASSGSVTLSLPKGSSFNIDADVSSGDIKIDFPVTVSGSMSEDRIKGSVGEGTGDIKIETSSGNINILSI